MPPAPPPSPRPPGLPGPPHIAARAGGASGRRPPGAPARTPPSGPAARLPPASCFPPALPALARRGPGGPPTPARPPAGRGRDTHAHPAGLRCTPCPGHCEGWPRPPPAREKPATRNPHWTVRTLSPSPALATHSVTPCDPMPHQHTADSELPSHTWGSWSPRSPHITRAPKACHTPGHNSSAPSSRKRPPSIEQASDHPENSACLTLPPALLLQASIAPVSHGPLDGQHWLGTLDPEPSWAPYLSVTWASTCPSQASVSPNRLAALAPSFKLRTAARPAAQGRSHGHLLKDESGSLKATTAPSLHL